MIILLFLTFDIERFDFIPCELLSPFSLTQLDLKTFKIYACLVLIFWSFTRKHNMASENSLAFAFDNNLKRSYYIV